jgi:protein involved in polysaccharide export with SLBB domain
VPHPGRFAGERNDSLIYFLGEAGGVDPGRGSFRDIRILRGKQTITHIDLYDYLLDGVLTKLPFQDNDTIVVGPQQPTVGVAGAVHNSYRFELPGSRAATGATVIAMAKPQPKTSHVVIRGVRGGHPYNAYITLAEFSQSQVFNGDDLIFQADMVEETLFVGVIGQASGPSSFAVPNGTRLSQLLDMIAVDPRVAAVKDIYLRRKSVADRQKRALSLSLDQLQRSVLTTSTVSTSEAEMRVQEAKLVETFISKARSVQPEGRVVLATAAGAADMLIEADDVIVIPQQSNLVLISGEVQMPETLVYDSNKKIADYINDCGGFTDRADTGNVLVQHQNGEIITGSKADIRPGDHIMALPSPGNKALAIVKDLAQVLYYIAVSTGTVYRIL